MDFSAFDTKKMEEYAAQAKAAWGKHSHIMNLRKNRKDAL